MSKTSLSGAFSKKIHDPQSIENLVEAEEQLRSLEGKMKRGYDNFMHHKQAKSQRVRDYFKRVPDLDELKKRFEEENKGQWEKFLVKQQKMEASKKEIEKKETQVKKSKQQKLD